MCPAALPTHLPDNFLQGTTHRAPVEPAAMLWLIQRDFLEGKTVQAMLREALAPQHNALDDPDIAQAGRASFRVSSRAFDGWARSAASCTWTLRGHALCSHPCLSHCNGAAAAAGS